MKEPRPAPPGRRRGNGSGMGLPLTGSGGAASGPSPSSSLSSRIAATALVASGVVLVCLVLFSSSPSRYNARRDASSSSLPGAARSEGKAEWRGGVDDGVPLKLASTTSVARASSSSPPVDGDDPLLPRRRSLPAPRRPRPTLSPEEEAAFEADMIAMLAGEQEDDDEEEAEERKKSDGVGSTATAAVASAASAASRSKERKEAASSSSSSSPFSPAVEERESEKKHEATPSSRPHLFSAPNGNNASATTNASSSSPSRDQLLSRLLKDEGFDWRLYLAYNPDLRASGVPADEEGARSHYLSRGRADGRVGSRLRVTLRYTACTGLINQHYSHIAALSLASTIGADVVLPPAAQRDSFAHYFSTFADRNEVSWTSAPLETLLDVDALVESWRAERGVTLSPPPATSPFPDLTKPGTAWPMYGSGGGSVMKSHPLPDPSTVARVGDVYLRNLDMGSLVEKVRSAAVGKATALRRAQMSSKTSPSSFSSTPLPPLPVVTVDLPCTFFMLRTADAPLDVVTGVARSLRFAPLLVKLADRVARGVAQAAAAEAAAAEAVALAASSAASSSGSSSSPIAIRSTTSFPGFSSSPDLAAPTETLPFNGVHLRIESDARDWEEILGGRAALWEGYLSAARAATTTATDGGGAPSSSPSFDSRTPLYVASGLLTYGASEEMDSVASELVREGLASSVHYKEQHLSSSELEALNSEQKAAVDFLVLARSRAFVGLGSSTFSFYLREHRALEGIPRNTTVLVDASKIGTDDLFASAGVVV